MRQDARTWCRLAQLLAALSCGCSSLDTGSTALAIVDGTVDTSDPAIVAIGSRRVGCTQPLGVRCSGVLVAPRLVLTAAHCVGDPRLGSDLEVLFGTSPTDTAAAYVHVSSLALHPAYRVPGDEVDLAVLLLDRPVAIAPVVIDKGPLDGSLVGASVRIVGFGQTSPTGDPPGTKRSGTAVVSELQDRLFRTASGPSQACHGDSGGPVLTVRAGSEVLIGVAASGDPGCAQYGLNTRIDRVLDDFIIPWMAMAATDPKPAPQMGPPLAASELCSGACTVSGSGQCLDGLSCELTPIAGGLGGRCVLPGLLPGTLQADCSSDNECDGRCVRLGADDAPGACRCYRPCDGTSPPAGGGCSIRADLRPPPAPLVWVLLTLVGLGWRHRSRFAHADRLR